MLSLLILGWSLTIALGLLLLVACVTPLLASTRTNTSAARRAPATPAAGHEPRRTVDVLA
jgi:hypothetical protein